MAIPSGSGSEILTSTYIHAQSDTASTFRWDGTPASTGTTTYTVPANHIITILSIVFTEVDGNAEEIDLYVNDGSQDIYLLRDQPLSAKGTFVWNDKVVLKAGHKLYVLNTPSNVDCYCTYIDQDWT